MLRNNRSDISIFDSYLIYFIERKVENEIKENFAISAGWKCFGFLKCCAFYCLFFSLEWLLRNSECVGFECEEGEMRKLFDKHFNLWIIYSALAAFEQQLYRFILVVQQALKTKVEMNKAWVRIISISNLLLERKESDKNALSLSFSISFFNLFTIPGQLLQHVPRFLRLRTAGAFPETNEATSNAVLSDRGCYLIFNNLIK